MEAANNDGDEGREKSKKKKKDLKEPKEKKEKKDKGSRAGKEEDDIYYPKSGKSKKAKKDKKAKHDKADKEEGHYSKSDRGEEKKKKKKSEREKEEKEETTSTDKRKKSHTEDDLIENPVLKDEQLDSKKEEDNEKEKSENEKSEKKSENLTTDEVAIDIEGDGSRSQPNEVLPPIEEMTEQGGSRATTTDPKKSLQTKSSANLVTYSQPKVFTKDIDFVVFGASGFIGRMACLYLAEYPDRDFITRLHLAIAGRSKERLQQLQRELTAINSYMGRVSLLTANAFSTDDLDRITARSRCLLNFAGPYAWYGSLVLESCVRNMCHYVDLSGELPWVVKMMEKHEARAVKNKVRVINACGFASVPSEMGVLSAVNYIKKNWKEGVSECYGLLAEFKSGVNGNFEVMMANFQNENKNYYDEMMNEPQFFNPPDKRNGLDEPDLHQPFFMKDIKTWTSPSTTAPLNCRIVRRSNAIIGYGEKFTYREMVMNSNWMTAKLSQSKLSFKSSGNTVRHDENINPKTAFAKCYFKMKIIATPAESTDKRVACEVKGKGDPENQLTAKMMVEAGICLSKYNETLPKYVNGGHGFQTPASGLGATFLQRLKQYAGITFNCEEIALQ